ncbi:MAG: helix-turn-helix transcriptional regulator [Rhizobiales bacterium]|nr:helix-turn-helix transcriptional regulator [Hyphomicrobiales bacterium]
MNKPQTIQTPSGEEMVVLSRADYEELLSATEELEDALAAERSLARIAAGKVELIPEAEVDDYLDAPTPLAFWRRKRGMTQAALAERVGVSITVARLFGF